MGRHLNQKGSAHVVVTVCLTLALVTALGWIFYQNFIYKDQARKETDLLVVEKDTKEEEDVPETTLVRKSGYAFKLPIGFKEVDDQQFSYTASLKAEHSYLEEETGRYFEVLKPSGPGGGISADIFWSYELDDKKISVRDRSLDLCAKESFSCTNGNGSLEIIVSPKNKDEVTYYFAFGNKTSESTTDSHYIDTILDSFVF